MAIAKEKYNFMLDFAERNNVILNFNTTCGFGRDCVGITAHGVFPDYAWYDDDYNDISGNDDIFIPVDAYHKHPCVAVLGTGSVAEEQLYQWLKWFDDNDYHVMQIENPPPESLDEVELYFWSHYKTRMIKKVLDL